MKMFSTSIEETQNKNVYQVGIAVDSNVYYAALVDVSTNKSYVEEIGLSQKKSGFQGVYREITNTEEWKKAYDFFVHARVFDKFQKGTNWYWDRAKGRDNVPSWFLEGL